MISRHYRNLFHLETIELCNERVKLRLLHEPLPFRRVKKCLDYAIYWLWTENHGMHIRHLNWQKSAPTLIFTDCACGQQHRGCWARTGRILEHLPSEYMDSDDEFE